MNGFYIVGGLGLLTLMATICFVMDLLTPSEDEIVVVRKITRPVEHYSIASEYEDEPDVVMADDYSYDES